jgi:hypothetical protein
MKSIPTILLLAICFEGFCQNGTNSDIFNGGIADGWASQSIIEPSANIFNGGPGDGWAFGEFLQPADNIFVGDGGDGWAASEIVTLGISENTFQSAIEAYPNPTSGMVNIVFGNFQDLLTVEVYTISGQLVSKKDYSQTQFIAFYFEAAQGMYLIKVTSGDQSAVIKILKR